MMTIPLTVTIPRIVSLLFIPFPKWFLFMRDDIKTCSSLGSGHVQLAGLEKLGTLEFN